MSLRRSILFPSQHSLKVFHVFTCWFLFRLYTCPANILFEEVFRLQKTSWSRRICSAYSLTSSRRLGQDQYICLGHTSSRRLQDIFKTSSRRLARTSSKYLQDVYKMFWKRLQDIFKTHYQLKVFLVTQFQDIFDTYSKRFWEVLLRRLSTGGLPRSHFWEIYGHCAKLSSDKNFSSFNFSLYYTF